MVENRGKLMWASFLTLIAAGMGMSIRGGILLRWGENYGFTQLELGAITGGGLLGFGIVIIIASLFIDRIGYKSMLVVAFLLHLLSIVVTLSATPVYGAAGKDATFYCLFIGVFIFAVANGLCEAVINPLIANIYPEQKTHYLNILHAGWPGGLIIGGLLGLALVRPGIPWEVPQGLYLLPVLWYGYIIFTEKFPESDVAKAGISFGQMLLEFASPVLLFLLLLHACVGYVELGTDSWITNITETMTQQGFLLFVYASAIMFVLRFVAGPIVEKINPLGLLCLSAILGTTGLFMLGSIPNVAWMAWVAVTIYGVGKTFLWPTMLGIVGERYPRGGALTMGMIGGVGMLSAGLLGAPGIGYKQDYYASAQLKSQSQPTYDRYAADDAGGFLFFPEVRGLNGQKVGVLLDTKDGQPAPANTLNNDYEIAKKAGDVPEPIEKLKTWWDETAKEHAEKDRPHVEDARIYGGQMALKLTSAVPAFMFFGYLILVVYFWTRGGYTQVDISGKDEKDEGKPPS